MSDKALRLSLGTILGAGIILCLVVGGLTFVRLNRAEDNTTATLTQKADALFTAIEAGARSGRRGPGNPMAGRMPRISAGEDARFEEGLRGILEELSDQPDIRFVAVTDPEGRILAHSNPRHVGSALFSPLDMEELHPNQAVQWRMIDFPNGQAFLVYREFTPLRDPPPPPSPSTMRHPQPPPHPLARSFPRQQPEEFSDNPVEGLPAPERKERRFHHGAGGIGLAPVIFVAYDPAPFIKAQTDRKHQNLLETAVATLLGLVALVLLFWRENLSQTRRLLGETRAFANEVVGSFPDGLVVLDTKGNPVYINSTARRFLGLDVHSGRPGYKGHSQPRPAKDQAALDRNGQSTVPDTNSATTSASGPATDLSTDLATDLATDLTTDLIGQEGFLSPSAYPDLPPSLKEAMKQLERDNFTGSRELPCLENLLSPLVDFMPGAKLPDANSYANLAVESSMESPMESPMKSPGAPDYPIADSESEKRDHGATCCFELRGARVRSVQDGNLLHGAEMEHIADLLIIRDLTELKNLQQNLRQSEKLAAVGSLAAGVAHEIRNPLSSIKGYASIFARLFAADSPEQEAALALGREAERLNRAVSDLLSIASSSNLRMVPTELKKLLEHSILLINADARKQGVKLEPRLDDTPPCDLDPDRISQAMLNLLLNALEAMPDGGTLKVTLTSRTGSQQTAQRGSRQQWARISVTDSGKGINPADLPRIFDPYFTTKADGTGLGLATTQKIIQAHGGRIEAQSGPGGATFIVSLPMGHRA